MRRTGLVIDPRYFEHRTPEGHPECPERLRVLTDMAQRYRRQGLVRIAPRAAEREEILRIHASEYYDTVAKTAERPHFAFDADTYTSSRSFEAALLSAGGLLALIEAIMNGEIDNGFALVRPPGHHAEWDRAMGFCLFNNIAVGASHLRAAFGMERILIVDWDVHHGNGTQWSFYEDPAVLYVSTHQYPFYPGTGDAHEIGSGEGTGFTVNIPLPAGFGDAQYIGAFRHVIAPISRQFNPQFVLISAGFDAHARDPLASMNVTEDGFAEMARIVLGIAEEYAEGRCAAVLEGGYDASALERSVMRVLDEMGGGGSSLENSAEHPEFDALSRVRTIQRQHWEL